MFDTSYQKWGNLGSAIVENRPWLVEPAQLWAHFRESLGFVIQLKYL